MHGQARCRAHPYKALGHGGAACRHPYGCPCGARHSSHSDREELVLASSFRSTGISRSTRAMADITACTPCLPRSFPGVGRNGEGDVSTAEIVESYRKLLGVSELDDDECHPFAFSDSKRSRSGPSHSGTHVRNTGGRFSFGGLLTRFQGQPKQKDTNKHQKHWLR